MRSKSYEQCGCGADCNYENEKEPCWGVVLSDEVATDDDSFTIHFCEGHGNKYDGGEYIKEVSQRTVCICHASPPPTDMMMIDPACPIHGKQ